MLVRCPETPAPVFVVLVTWLDNHNLSFKALIRELSGQRKPGTSTTNNQYINWVGGWCAGGDVDGV